MGLAVDTSALVDLERRGPGAGEGMLYSRTDLFVPALVVAEIWVGVACARTRRIREEREAKIRALLRTMQVLPFTEEIAPTFARLFAQQRRIGRPIPAIDLTIAATALHHGHDLLVGRSDEAHFRSVRGLRLYVLSV